MPWKCPSCGRQNYETFNNCSCGYSYSEAVLTKHGLSEYQDLSEEAGQLRDVALNCVSDCTVSLDEPAEPYVVQNPERSDSAGVAPHEEVIKEIDSWLFTFSDADNSVSISTPALKSFSLKLSLEDIEELLEFLYEKTGNEKTMRKIGIGATDVLGVIDKVDRMIEEKKSKVSIKFSSEELQDITEFINMQLKA